MANQYYDGPEFQQGGKVAHQVDSKIKVDSMPTEKTLIQLKNQLNVDEEYEEAFEIARRLLKCYHNENPIRNSSYYAAAALYFGLRCKKAPYLIIEISQFIGDGSATKIAKCYLKLLKYVQADVQVPFLLELSQKLQYIDPSIYIPKFLKALELSDKNQYEIIKGTALKLLKRMILDWMAFGRRPSSLCGAALLISARFHGENVKSSKICQIVQICDETLRKRLLEFNQTGLSELTKEQFEQLQNIENLPGPVSDPPSFKRLKQKEKQLTEEQYKELQNKQKELQENVLLKMMQTKITDILQIKPYIQNEKKVEDNQRFLEKQDEGVKLNRIDVELSSLSENEEQIFICDQKQQASKKVDWIHFNMQYISDRNKKIEKKKKKIEIKNNQIMKDSIVDQNEKCNNNKIINNQGQNNHSRMKGKREYACDTPQESLEKTFENEKINKKALAKLFDKYIQEDQLASYLGNTN